jgi:glyoxylase-like metal-dependent hydrolase (beta-lactamase superfamily II)
MRIRHLSCATMCPPSARLPRWCTYEARGEPWNGFACVRAMEALPPEILMIPVIGHTRGHAAIAVDSGAGWLLHCGDAYFFHGEMDPEHPQGTPALSAFQRLVAIDDRARVENQARLRALGRDHAGDVKIFCAHDPEELDRLRQGAP